jgi:hypothetical protein
LSGGVARSSQSTWVGMYGRVCRKLILESLNRESTVCEVGSQLYGHEDKVKARTSKTQWHANVGHCIARPRM